MTNTMKNKVKINFENDEKLKKLSIRFFRQKEKLIQAMNDYNKVINKVKKDFLNINNFL